uniref:Uncharacterized protein n=1 Tax=Arundo donax TaxID=35708 RepID=A0A0A9FE22_ARUDO
MQSLQTVREIELIFLPNLKVLGFNLYLMPTKQAPEIPFKISPD